MRRIATKERGEFFRTDDLHIDVSVVSKAVVILLCVT